VTVELGRLGAARLRRRALATALAGIGLLAAACEPVANAAPAFAALDTSLDAAFLTPEGHDTYSLTVLADDTGAETVTARAASTNTGTNTRVAFWRRAEPSRRDQQSCLTWSRPDGGLSQPGIALRVATGGGRSRAITVTQNILFGGAWGFNIHVMDSAGSPATRRIAGFDLGATFNPGGHLVPYPWRMCARAVAGTVSFKVWPVGQPEPAWNDPAHGGSVRLPPEWVRAVGRPGWYVGHLAPGESIRFHDLAVASVAATPVGSQPIPRVDATTTALPAEPTTPPRAPTDDPTAP
jgi:hypothetical protein